MCSAVVFVLLGIFLRSGVTEIHLSNINGATDPNNDDYFLIFCAIIMVWWNFFLFYNFLSITLIDYIEFH